jgi:plastocyanin
MHGSRLRRVVAVAAVAGAFLLSLFAASSLGAATGPLVHIRGNSFLNYKFAPRKVSVAPGTKVRWRWNSNAPHNVTFQKLGEASDTAASGSFSLKFNTPGTYRYVCTVHGFTGVVTVG